MSSIADIRAIMSLYEDIRIRMSITRVRDILFRMSIRAALGKRNRDNTPDMSAIILTYYGMSIQGGFDVCDCSDWWNWAGLIALALIGGRSVSQRMG